MFTLRKRFISLADLLVWPLAFLSLTLHAQQVQPYFQSYTTQDGLGGESINDLLIDRYGYVWTAAHSGLHRYDGYDFLEFSADPLDSCVLSNRIILCLLEDTEGDIWIGTRSGLNRLNRTTGCFRRYFHRPGTPGSLPGDEIIHLALDSAGTVVVQTTAGTATYRADRDDFSSFPTPSASWHRLVLHQNRLLAAGPAGLADPARPVSSLIPFADTPPTAVNVVQPRGDSLLIGTDNGLWLWDGRDSLLRRAYRGGPDNRLPVLDLLPVELHGLDGYWVATRGQGLAFFDLASGQGGTYTAGYPRAFSLLDNHVRSLAYDPAGNLWIGTFVGLNRLELGTDGPVYFRNSDSDGLAEQILEIHAASDGAVFLYERWRGLFRSERFGSKMQAVDFPQNEFLISKDLNHITNDRAGNVWILRGNDALYRHDPARDEPVLALRDSSLTTRRLNMLAQDPADDNVYWIASGHGLGRLRLAERELKWWLPTSNHRQLAGNVIAALCPAPDGRVWISAGNYYNDHLGYFDPAAGTFRFYDYRPGDPERSAGGRIKQIAVAPDGSVWAAATQGLLNVDPKTDHPRLITRVGAAALGPLEAVLTDTTGVVWFTSDDQIGRYNPPAAELSWLTCPPIRQFGNAVATVHPDGRLLFGGMGGIAAVEPYASQDAAGSFPRLVLNDIRINGRSYITDQPAQEVRELRLRARERNLALRFAGLLSDRNRHLAYAYRIDDRKWRDLGTDRSLSFANLQPGSFRLGLRSTDGQGNWNPEVRHLLVSVAPFWYETITARLAILLLGLLLSGLAVRLFLRRRLERQSLAQLRELDAFKSRFLTNLTHEFRTPLTLILGPARRLRQQADPTIAREGRRVFRQGKRLLGLIDQLLDLRRLEEGKFTVREEAVDLRRWLGDITESFREQAAEQQIHLDYQANLGGAGAGAMMVDRSKVESIVTNLLANAIKFTPDRGRVAARVTEQGGHWVFTVGDSGPGVAEQQREHIFERFARGNTGDVPGTGIGLAVAREFARLLGGSLTVGEADLGGALFSLRMPLRKAPLRATSGLPPDRPKTQSTPLPTGPEEPLATVLVVEDNAEVREYLTESLSGRFTVLSAPDGAAGLALAFREIPDLVVSDVMMPGLSGLQLCTRLKNDRRTSHLPVLLLTARTAEHHRLQGLEHGADAYLTKPFTERELDLRLRNLLTLRNRTAARLQQQFLAGPAPADDAPLPVDSSFLTELRRLIGARLDDPDFGVADLESGLGLSRSQLHRKLTAALGLSANKLINQLRLEAAAERLRTTEDPISAIAYDCGFRDVGYFGKKFRGKYGMSAGEFRKG